MDQNLHSGSRRLIELRMAQAELESKLERLVAQGSSDELSVRRLKKQCIKLRDQIARLEAELDPPQPA
ncbi:MAG: YdcH family protein [Burkholderiaceae bacterium]